MAANHTTNYHLNTWEPGDSFLRTEFNENFTKLDTALKTETDARAALAQTVAGAMVAGSYTLNGQDITVSLGFRPRLIIFTLDGRETAIFAIKGETVDMLHSLYRNVLNFSGGTTGATITDSGFQLRAEYALNRASDSGSTLNYLAFR